MKIKTELIKSKIILA